MPNPSDFSKQFPYGSRAGKTEAEVVAKNIMMILERTGDKFRVLPWDEYKAERLKDGEFSNQEYDLFKQVIGFCKSADTATLFAPAWNLTA